jgi:hypothetical protein
MIYSKYRLKENGCDRENIGIAVSGIYRFEKNKDEVI